MKKSLLFSLAEGFLMILPPLLINAVLTVLFLRAHTSGAVVFGLLSWLCWLTALIIILKRHAAGAALTLGGLLFCSCGFYGLYLMAKYELFSLSAGVHALCALFGAPYGMTTAGIMTFLPEEGSAAIFSCIAYLFLVITASVFAAVRFGKKKK